MKTVKSLLLGAAAGFVALTGAQAADLPGKAAPAEYVRICDTYRWDATSEQVEDVYFEVLRTRRSSRTRPWRGRRARAVPGTTRIEPAVERIDLPGVRPPGAGDGVAGTTTVDAAGAIDATGDRRAPGVEQG